MRMEGLPSERADLRAARNCVAVLGAAGVRANIEDFMPQFDGEERERGVSVEDGKAMIEAFNRAASKMKEQKRGD